MAFTTTAKHALRVLTGGSAASDIDAGFSAIASDVDALLTPYQRGVWAALPAAGKQGRSYYATDLGYYLKDTGTAWELVNGVPIGDLTDTLRATDPPGGYYLLADGRTISSTSYPAYFTALGLGGGSVALPDLRGRSVAMPNAGQTGNTRIALALGAVTGEAAHTLTPAETALRAHTHDAPSGRDGYATVDSPAAFYGSAGATALPLTGPDAATGGVTGGEQSGAAHNVVHPVVGLNKLIRVK